MVSDLEAVIKDKVSLAYKAPLLVSLKPASPSQATVLSTSDVKAYMQMILRGLEACHQRWVIHR